jgi:amidase
LIDFPNVIFKTGLTFDPKIDTEGPSNIPDFNPEDYVNAPIGLQLTGRRFQDEKVVEGVKLLDSVLGLQ